MYVYTNQGAQIVSSIDRVFLVRSFKRKHKLTAIESYRMRSKDTDNTPNNWLNYGYI